MGIEQNTIPKKILIVDTTAGGTFRYVKQRIGNAIAGKVRFGDKIFFKLALTYETALAELDSLGEGKRRIVVLYEHSNHPNSLRSAQEFPQLIATANQKQIPPSDIGVIYPDTEASLIALKRRLGTDWLIKFLAFRAVQHQLNQERFVTHSSPQDLVFIMPTQPETKELVTETAGLANVYGIPTLALGFDDAQSHVQHGLAWTVLTSTMGLADTIAKSGSDSNVMDYSSGKPISTYDVLNNIREGRVPIILFRGDKSSDQVHNFITELYHSNVIDLLNQK